ncbi:hypothetical protein [Caenimonas soli]|uniref:hypothetical protein n=1 Tax=Caenimonas soli TaxID=2735555 RepID=UPI0015540E3B|nr:hypothetical protein [Caenimonas soli]NPC54828.1 hypothetical protein [Caenimonas soli]
MTEITRISIGDLQTRVCVDAGFSSAVDLQLGIGLMQLGRGPFRREPPSELELESAIAFVEEAVMPLAKVLPPSTKLVSSDAIASRLLALAQPAGQDTGVLTLQQVEHIFGELAAVSLGRPSSSSGVPTDGPFVSYVLILREFMHHLAFDDIGITRAP